MSFENSHTVTNAFVFITGGISFGTGILVFWANPKRFTNQAFSAGVVILLSQLICIHKASTAGYLYKDNNMGSPILWLQIGAAISTFFPWVLWMLRESLISGETKKLKIIKRSLPLLVFGVGLSIVCFTHYFIPPDSSPIARKRGMGYVSVVLALDAYYIFFTFQTWSRMRKQTGIRRIEMQFLVLNLGIAAILATIFAVFGNLLNIPLLKKLTIIVFFFSYVVSAWAVNYHRIFDVRQVFLSLMQRVGLLILLGIGIISTRNVLELFLPPSIALAVGAAFFGSMAFWLDRKSREWLDLGGERILAEMRSSTIALAMKESTPEKLVLEFETFLVTQSHTNFAALLFDNGEGYVSGELLLRKDRPGCTYLAEIGWATPESLERRRPSLVLADLREFIIDKGIGIMTASPLGSRHPSLLLVLGEKTQSWPFTYPEVQRLQNVTELMDNILTRSRLAAQAATQARVEHLAMMSRGLAHDLKNLITPVSTFLIHTDNRFSLGSDEAEVHSAALRSVRIMTDYVREALFFSERLAPRFQAVNLPSIFEDVRDLTATRAGRRNIVVSLASDFQGPLCADAVLLQRLLGNLVANAIDASACDQIVSVSAGSAQAGWLRLQVSDQGCGIAPEHLARIFDPYFTTKEFGDDVRGFGLGLTICQKIVHLHGGKISVESQLGSGATFTVDLPTVQEPSLVIA